MEVLFILLLLVWIISQLFPQESSPAERETTAPGNIDRSPTSHDREKSTSLRNALREIEGHLGDPGTSSRESDQHWESASPSSAQPGRSPTRHDSELRESATSQQAPSTSRAGRATRGRSRMERDATISSFAEKHPRPSGRQDPGIDKHTVESLPPRTRIKNRLKRHRTRREMYLFKELIDPPRSQRPWPR